jgi:hypothetical protein
MTSSQLNVYQPAFGGGAPALSRHDHSEVLLSTVLAGMAGVYLLKDPGIAILPVKPAIPGVVILGGLIFGIGWGPLGFLSVQVCRRTCRRPLGCPVGTA